MALAQLCYLKSLIEINAQRMSTRLYLLLSLKNMRKQLRQTTNWREAIEAKGGHNGVNRSVVT